MPTVEIVDPESGRSLVIETGAARLLDLCDEEGAPVRFSCRSATCGTCLVEVESGHALLGPTGDDERETLALFDAGPAARLACQIVVLDGSGRVRLRTLGGA